jgi:hypothetical protein
MKKIFDWDEDILENEEDAIARVIESFSCPGGLDDAELHYAVYGIEDYADGSAEVVFERGGKLFAVYGSHCSCYGLEDQWEPHETDWETLAMRSDELGAYAKFMISSKN